MKNLGPLLVGALLLGAVVLGGRKAYGVAPIEKTPGTPSMPTPTPYTPTPDIYDAFAGAEFDYDLPFGILQSMAGIESGFRPEVINCTVLGASGEKGIMQIHPKWHPNVDACNPFKAIDYAGRYLRGLHNTTGSWRLAVAAYNWGIGNLTNKGYAAAPLSTKRYVEKVAREVGI